MTPRYLEDFQPGDVHDLGEVTVTAEQIVEFGRLYDPQPFHVDPEAAAKALGSFERVRWIAGGREKAGGIEALRPLFGRVTKAYLIGEAAEGFAATLGATPHVVSGTLAAAVREALAEAEPGETVLLAPACSSFDQFASFEARGDAFVALVREATGGAA